MYLQSWLVERSLHLLPLATPTTHSSRNPSTRYFAFFFLAQQKKLKERKGNYLYPLSKTKRTEKGKKEDEEEERKQTRGK